MKHLVELRDLEHFANVVGRVVEMNFDALSFDGDQHAQQAAGQQSHTGQIEGQCGTTVVADQFRNFIATVRQVEVVENFTRYGHTDAFRLFIGAAEVSGAIGLWIPRLAFWAALGLIIIMLGAVYTHVTHAENPIGPWSTRTTIFRPGNDLNEDHAYGAYIHVANPRAVLADGSLMRTPGDPDPTPMDPPVTFPLVCQPE